MMKMSAAPANPTPHRLFPSWLGGEHAAAILSYAAGAEARFEVTGIGSTDRGEGGQSNQSFRRSLRLRDLGPFSCLLCDRALLLQRELETAFGMGHTSENEAEIELVTHGDGGFYRAHIDTFTGDGITDVANRRLSLVYYLHNRPRRFTGGNLRLFAPGSVHATVIEPEHDTLLAFPSFLPHEVDPISCPGGSFIDGRFSVNIWLRG